MGTNFPEVGKFYVISWYNEIPASTWLQNTGRAIYFMYVGIITSTRQGRRYVALVHTDLTVHPQLSMASAISGSAHRFGAGFLLYRQELPALLNYEQCPSPVQTGQRP